MSCLFTIFSKVKQEWDFVGEVEVQGLLNHIRKLIWQFRPRNKDKFYQIFFKLLLENTDYGKVSFDTFLKCFTLLSDFYVYPFNGQQIERLHRERYLEESGTESSR